MLRTDQDYLDAGYTVRETMNLGGREVKIWQKEHTRESWAATGRAFRKQEEYYDSLPCSLPVYSTFPIGSRFD